MIGGCCTISVQYELLSDDAFLIRDEISKVIVRRNVLIIVTYSFLEVIYVLYRDGIKCYNLFSFNHNTL